MGAFLQSYVLPVCTFEKIDGAARFKLLFGTAFLVNDGAICLTAGHVIEAARTHAEANGQTIGLIGKAQGGVASANIVAPITAFEHAPKPFDVAILHSQYKSKSPLKLGWSDVHIWREVAALGYPDNATSGPATDVRINVRGLRGYVQRELVAGDVPLGEHPDGFELSFLVSRGMSGAPLFIHRGGYDEVVGICVGSVRSEMIEDRHVEIQDNGREYQEISLKVDEYGHAHDVRGLRGWAPISLEGRTLEQIVGQDER